MALAAPTTKDPADRETTNQHGDKYNDWHNKASQQREALFFYRLPRITRTTYQATETLNVSKGTMALNLAFESLKTAGNAETNEIRYLSVFHKNLPRRHHRGPARLSQGLPRWAGPRPVKTKNPTSLQLFFD